MHWNQFFDFLKYYLLTLCRHRFKLPLIQKSGYSKHSVGKILIKNILLTVSDMEGIALAEWAKKLYRESALLWFEKNKDSDGTSKYDKINVRVDNPCYPKTRLKILAEVHLVIYVVHWQ